MAGVTTLKRRITSVKNTRQITKAMELVSASKMRHAQEYAINSRPFKEQARLLIGQLSSVSDAKLDDLFANRPVKNELLVVVCSDQGLAGAYNSNVLKKFIEIIKQNKADKINTDVISIGRYAGKFVAKHKGLNHHSAYPMLGDHPSPQAIAPMIEVITSHYLQKKIDRVKVVYTQFISSIRQEVVSVALIPYLIDPDDKKTETRELSPLEVAIFEPSVEEIIESVGIRLIEVQLWQALLEAGASEQSMRMMAMKNASDNAGDIIEDLTLALNTARQAAITQEIDR